MDTVKANVVWRSICSKLLSLKTLPSFDSNQTWPIYHFTHKSDTADNRHFIASSLKYEKFFYFCKILLTYF